MAGKKSKRGKTVKGRKVAKRAAKKTVLMLPLTLGKVVAAAVAQGMNHALDKVVMEITARAPATQADRTITPIQQPDKPEPRLAHLGADQRFTKNIGNFESFVCGFSLNIPIEVDPSDNIESAETRAKLRPKYEATMGFLNEMLKEVGKEVDVARGAVPQ